VKRTLSLALIIVFSVVSCGGIEPAAEIQAPEKVRASAPASEQVQPEIAQSQELTIHVLDGLNILRVLGPFLAQKNLEKKFTQLSPNPADIFSSLVNALSCIKPSLSQGMLAFDFNQCQLLNTGQTLTGTIGFTIDKLFPFTLTVHLIDLEVANQTFNGSLTLTSQGFGKLPLISAKISLPLGGSTMTLEIYEAKISFAGLSLVLNGKGNLQAAFLGGDFDIVDLTWQFGQCLPSSGELQFPQIFTTVSFLPTTPATGAVEIQVPFLPPFEQAFLPACPF